ncbi:MMPL family transporter [Spongiibacter sp. KMU-166]|uniref:MMPL family transporter n=1 Tax=Spongiibacter thalassae TaxID=2721624 RepID=A0ABX1GMK7_9GAMM|nr:MMPL family transporter [Spongiibacter thalassae]NKI19623.1 MMPL family transporter [Spongiibacter thalassae]
MLVIRKRLTFFWLTLAALLAVTPGLQYLEIDSSYHVYFDKDDPQYVAHNELIKHFTPPENLIFIVTPDDNRVFSKESLEAIKWLTLESWKIPYATHVQSVSNFQYTSVVQDELVIRDFVDDSFTLDSHSLAELENIALNEPEIVDHLISKKGEIAFINVKLLFHDISEHEASAEATIYAEKVRAQFSDQFATVKLHIVGLAPFNYAMQQINNADILLLLPVMFITIFFLLSFFLQSFVASLLAMSMGLASVAFTMALCGYAGVKLNSVSSGAPIIILTLAIATCVHLLSHTNKSITLGKPILEALQDSITSTLKPIFLTSFTTSIGFLSTNFSDSPPLRETGTIASIGVMSSFCFTYSLLPQLACWLLPSKRQSRNLGYATFDTGLVRLAQWIILKRNKLFFTIVCFTFAVVPFVSKNVINDGNIHYLSEDTPYRQAAMYAESYTSALNAIDYVISTKIADGINDVYFLQQVDDFVQWYKSQPEVVHVYTYTDTLRRLNKNMHSNNPEWYVIPDSRELAAQYLLLYEMSLPYGMSLDNQIDINRSALRVTVAIKNLKSKEILALEQRAQHWLSRNTPEIMTSGVGRSIMFAHIGEDNIRSMLLGTVLAILFITITLLVSLGAWRLAILSLIPNTIPILITLGLWGAIVGEINLVVAVVFSVTLGIVVDDTVHILTYYLRSRKQGNSAETAIIYSFSQAGMAIVVSTITLATGFMILGLSDFLVNATLGRLVSITLIVALIYDFFFLPPLLIYFERFLNIDATYESYPPHK